MDDDPDMIDWLTDEDIRILISSRTGIVQFAEICESAERPDLELLASSLKGAISDIRTQLEISDENRTVEWEISAKKAKKWLERKIAIVKKRLTDLHRDDRLSSLTRSAAKDRSFVEAASQLLDKPTVSRIWLKARDIRLAWNRDSENQSHT
jgi:hypothetical protein